MTRMCPILPIGRVRRWDLVEAFDEPGLAGALLAEATDGRHDVVALPWCEDRVYGLLSPAVARERWVRVVSRLSIACATDAMVFTALVDADEGVRRWQALTVDAWPVLLTDCDGRNPRPWLLREDCVYHVDYDIEHGWQVWARTEDAATISGVPPLVGPAAPKLPRTDK